MMAQSLQGVSNLFLRYIRKGVIQFPERRVLLAFFVGESLPHESQPHRNHQNQSQYKTFQHSLSHEQQY